MTSQQVKKAVSYITKLLSYAFLIMSIFSASHVSYSVQSLSFHMFLIAWGADKVLSYIFNDKLYIGPYLKIESNASKPIRVIGLLIGIALMLLGISRILY